jgi:hypothetical protein
MTREERKAERRAQQAQIAVRVWAHCAAKREVKARIRAEGHRIAEFTGREITIRAEALLKERPEFIAEARVKAAALGYAIPTI